MHFPDRRLCYISDTGDKNNANPSDPRCRYLGWMGLASFWEGSDMDFYKETQWDLNGNPVVRYKSRKDDEPIGLVARVKGTWRVVYSTPGHTTDHAQQHEAELALCEAIIGV